MATTEEEIETREAVLKALDNMTIPEVVAVTNQLKDKWGIAAELAPIDYYGTCAPAYGGFPGSFVEEQVDFTCTLVEVGPKKIEVIKAVRNLLALGLAEAKTSVETVERGQPLVLAANVSKAEANNIQHNFEAVGAKVTVS